MSAPRDLITDALDLSGVTGLGQVAPASDVAKAFRYLNQLAAQWSHRQWLPPSVPATGFPGIDADIGLAPEFDAALTYALAVRLRPAYQLPADEILTAMLADALDVIRKSNVQAVTAPAAGGFTANTPRSLIALALKAAGALKPGQVAPVADVADAYALLQQMAGQWARKRWLVPHLADVAVPLSGAAAITIGPGGDVDRVRPDRIEAAYLRSRPGALNPLDWPMTLLDSREDWNRIQLKAMRGWPCVLFYDSGFPLGTLNVYPAPPLNSAAYELHLSVKDGVGAFGSLDAPFSLPAEYEAALLYNLAARLRLHYGLPPEPALAALALDALDTLRRANTQIPHLRMPPGLPGMRGRGAGAWQAGLVGGGGDPGFNQAGGFRVGISLLDGTDIAT